MLKWNPVLLTSLCPISWCSYKELILTLLCSEIFSIDTPTTRTSELGFLDNMKPVDVAQLIFFTLSSTRFSSIGRLWVIAPPSSEAHSTPTSSAALSPPAPAAPSPSLTIMLETVSPGYVLTGALTSSIYTPLK